MSLFTKLLPFALGLGAAAMFGPGAAAAIPGTVGAGATGATAAGAGGGIFGAGGLLGAGATGAGAVGSTAGLGTAFGSADMLTAANVANNVANVAPLASGISGAAEGALPPMLENPNMMPMADGSYGLQLEANGMTPNSFTGGYDSLNGFERFGQRIGHGFDKLSNDPLSILKNISPSRGGIGAPQEGNNRPVAMTGPRNQVPSPPIKLAYGGGLVGENNNLPPEKMWQLLAMKRAGILG